jgi:hypothetical protein
LAGRAHDPIHGVSLTRRSVEGLCVTVGLENPVAERKRGKKITTHSKGVVTDLDNEDGDDVISLVPQRFWRPIGTQRTLQIVLGAFWILDAALQFQPFMFGRVFVETFILPNAQGQPAVVSWIIRNIGHFIEPNIAVWNTLFAVVQLVIGVGLFFPRTVRYALALSFAWVLGVWVLGEGLGMVLTGSATALTGAPGSVLMYGLIGLMAWPTGRQAAQDAVGVASSAAAKGAGGVLTPLVVWAGYWSLAAVLFVLPQNRGQTSISSAITGMASGNPGWYDHFLHGTGSSLSSSGTALAGVLAALALLIGFGPLLSRRPGMFLAAGAVLSFVMWVLAQGWIGGIFSGSGTDPNTGPLVIVIALAMTPAVVAPSGARTPLIEAAGRHGVWVGLGLGSLATALLLSALYPAPAAQSSGTAMNGMAGMPGSSSSDTASMTSGTKGCTGQGHNGLDVKNSPIMTMGGKGTMNMNGTDASAAAGLNTVKANWHYTGPALPSSLTQVLLANGGNGPEQVHMAVSGCTPRPTATEELKAVQFVQATSDAVGGYTSPAAAEAAGYVDVSPTNYPIVYYVNPTTVAQNEAAGRTLDPSAIDGLVFATTPSGSQVLAAVMYLLPPPQATDPPMPYGSLVQWHQRRGVCVPETASSTSPFEITGFTPCLAGSTVGPTPYVSMVWQVPVAGGPLAIQPPDIQILEAATMQTSS